MACSAGRSGGGGGSCVVVELDGPAPFGAVGGVPPGIEHAGFTAGEDDDSAEVRIGGPAVFARQLGAVALDAGEGIARTGALERRAVSHHAVLRVADGDR